MVSYETRDYYSRLSGKRLIDLNSISVYCCPVSLPNLALTLRYSKNRLDLFLNVLRVLYEIFQNFNSLDCEFFFFSTCMHI